MKEYNFKTTNQIITEGLGRGIPFDDIKIPDRYHHYCGLYVCGEILSGSIWLSHAEFSNDEEEVRLGKSMIRERIHAFKLTNPAFALAVENDFERIASIFEVYIWCLSAFDEHASQSEYKGVDPSGAVTVRSSMPQDNLSQWRAYGADGKGCSITVSRKSIIAILSGTLRLNPVLYDKALSYNIIDIFLNMGLASRSPASTAAALIYLLPLIKHSSFKEEREWRLLYVQTKGASPFPRFHSSRDLYAPHHILSEVLRNDPSIASDPNVQSALSTGGDRLDFTEVLIGPSYHKNLNARGIVMKAQREGWTNLPVFTSAIPYRS